MPLFFHVDLDAFFASVEQRDHPEYRGKPVIIGLPVARSVVSTCSYEARKYGVHSAMPSVTAKKLCPNGIFVPPNMRLYSSVSKQVMSILKEYSPVFHQVSIDEARLDMTGTGRLFGPPKPLAIKIKDRVKEEIGITMSVGIASSPFIAKMASDYNKPDGLCMVSEGYEQKFIDAIGLEKIWGLGKSSIAAMHSRGLYTPSQAREISLNSLTKFFGKSMGSYIYKAVRGEDPNTYEDAKSHSISTETTFYQDVKDSESLHRCLLAMSSELMGRSLDEGVMAKTVGLKLRWGDFTTITVQTTPSYPILNADQIYDISKSLLSSRWKEGDGIRLIGLGLYQTYDSDKPVQDSLFSEEDHKKRELDKVVHDLEARGLKIQKASVLDKS